jgi:hypothetical protein
MQSTPSCCMTGAVLISLMIAGSAGSATTVTYDPGLGSLPEAQGYTYTNLAPGAPAPMVVAAELLQGPVPIVEQQYWIRNDFPFVHSGLRARESR